MRWSSERAVAHGGGGRTRRGAVGGDGGHGRHIDAQRMEAALVTAKRPGQPVSRERAAMWWAHVHLAIERAAAKAQARGFSRGVVISTRAHR